MSKPTIGGRMRGFALPYFVFLTVLRVLILRASDMLPKEGELLPRGGAWRPATEADRIRAFLWLTFCWYFGAAVAFGMMWRLAQMMYDVAFGSERPE
jgi:hypothetical protein